MSMGTLRLVQVRWWQQDDAFPDFAAERKAALDTGDKCFI